MFYFFSCDVFIWFWWQRILASWNDVGTSSSSSTLWNSVWRIDESFFNHLVELISDAIWSCVFLCGISSLLIFKFFFTCYRSIWIFYFFWISLISLCLPRNSFISSRLSNLLPYRCSWYSFVKYLFL